MPHTLSWWPKATKFQLMSPGHILGGIEAYTETVWSGSISKNVCGLGPSAETAWSGSIYHIKGVAQGHQLEMWGLGPSI